MAKALPVVRLATHKLLLSVDAVGMVELLATTLANKHMDNMLPNFVLVRRWQRFKSLVKDITGVNPPSLSCALSTHADPIQQQDEFPHKPALNTCRLGASKCTSFFMCSLKLILVLKLM